jgi:hypothetical protein
MRRAISVISKNRSPPHKKHPQEKAKQAMQAGTGEYPAPPFPRQHQVKPARRIMFSFWVADPEEFRTKIKFIPDPPMTQVLLPKGKLDRHLEHPTWQGRLRVGPERKEKWQKAKH